MEGERDEMVAEQLRPNGIVDERVLAAMRDIPREEFLPPDMRRFAYHDRALPIGCGQTMSQPLVVAAMTQALELEAADTALEIGTGSGYQAAVLARLCKRVITVEREPALAEQAAATLRRLGFDNVEVAVGDGNFGWPSAAPYPAILVAAAARQVPPALMQQMADGGRMAIPVGAESAEYQELLLVRRRGDRHLSELMFPVRFVPLI